ncbi:MAG: hypothetical protein CMO01_27180 [Thalassobius sp.]|nr:hypothetical protein [Thalassovita sp.]
MKDVISEMLKADIVTNVVSDHTVKMIIISGLVAKVFFMIDFGHNYLKTTLQSSGEKYFDVSRVIKGLIVIGIIWAYYPIFSFVDFLIEAINTATAPDMNDIVENVKLENVGVLNQEKAEALLSGEEILKPDGTKMNAWDVLINLNYKKIIFLLIDSIFVCLCYIVGTSVQIFALVSHRILFTLGPFALAFSILPYFEKARLRWMGAFVQTLFVFTVLHILNANVYEIMLTNLLQTGDPLRNDVKLTEVIGRLGLNVSIFGLYVSAFYLTGLIIGTGDTIGQAFNSSMTLTSNLIQATPVGKKLAAFGLKVK